MGKAKRGATDLSGIIAIDKPAGMTSHDVVDRLRRLTGEGRIGHAGTLDPAATGLLLVCIGPATRLSDLIMAKRKSYRARVVFGTATDTDDAQGQVIARAEVPEVHAERSFAEQVLASFLGESEQMPPQYSAIKKDGVRAYQKARKGETPELKTRTVFIHRIDLCEAGRGYWDIDAEVSKGTYIRSLARDIGEAVGTKAHLDALRRTSSGAVTLEDAITLDELERIASEMGAGGGFAEYLRSLFLDPSGDLGIEEQDIPKGLRDVLQKA